MKDTKIIAVGNQKGGCGKSMLSFQIGGSLAAHAPRVLIVDGDAQLTLKRVADLAKALGTTLPADVVALAEYGERLNDALSFYIGAHDFIVIDCPPSLEAPVFQSALKIADLALIPVVPSPPDLWSAVGTRELIARARSDNPDLDARIVLNRCKNTVLRREVIEQVYELGLPVLTTRVHDRTAYEEAWANGLTVLDMRPRPRDASVEIHNLLQEVLQIFVTRQREAAE